jgi:glycosyltransferase involved in cell wall biosynthesis
MPVGIAISILLPRQSSATLTQEAMAYGLPGIVSRQADSHYINNETGYVLEANDMEAFAEKIKLIRMDIEMLKYLKNGVVSKIKIYTTEKYQDGLKKYGEYYPKV